MTRRTLWVLSSLYLVACGTTSAVPRRHTLSFPAAKLAKAAKVELDVLTVRGRHGPGAVVPITLWVRPNDDGKLSVAFRENVSGSVGASLRASVWLAAQHAAQAIGRDPDEFAVEFSSPRILDGASIGAALTAGMMAAMSGVPLRKNVCLTGTLLPGGAVGPVGGVASKFIAGYEADKEVLGYPPGQHIVKHRRTKKRVDLAALAASQGGRAERVATVYEAFRLLTGKDFPRPFPVPPAAMALTGRSRGVLKEAVAKQRKYALSLLNNIRKLRIVSKNSIVKKALAAALRHAARAQALDSRGQLEAGLLAWQKVTRHGQTAQNMTMFFGSVAAKGPVGAITRLTNDRDGALKVLRALRTGLGMASEGGDRGAFASLAYQHVVAALDLLDQSRRAVKLSRSLVSAPAAKKLSGKKRAMLLIGALAAGAIVQSRAWARLATAETFLGIAHRMAGSERRSLPPEAVSRVVAQANARVRSIIVYYESLSKAARRGSRYGKERKRRLRRRARFTYHLAGHTGWKQVTGGSDRGQIAAAKEAHFAASELLFSALHFDRMSDVQWESNLNHAERMARVEAAIAKKRLGRIPMAAKLYYQQGRYYRHKRSYLILALGAFWRATMESRLAVDLGAKRGD